jgi:hypothetical protein
MLVLSALVSGPGMNARTFVGRHFNARPKRLTLHPGGSRARLFLRLRRWSWTAPSASQPTPKVMDLKLDLGYLKLLVTLRTA